MKTSFPRLLSLLGVFAVLSSSLSINAQGLNSASLSKTPNEIEANSGRVQAVIDKSENHFKRFWCK